MQFAPPAVQRIFWTQHNTRQRARPQTAGDAMRDMLAGGLGRMLDRQALIATVLTPLLSREEIAALTIGPLRRGLLTLYANSAPLAFAIERDHATTLLAALQREAPELNVRRIRVRVGGAA